MKRRSFIQKLSAGTSIGLLPAIPSRITKPGFYNPYEKLPSTIEEAKSQEGFIMVRIAFEGKNLNNIHDLAGSIQVINGKIQRQKEYFFESDIDEIGYIPPAYELGVYKNDTDVIVLWLDDVTVQTEIHLQHKKLSMKFALTDLLQKPQINKNEPDYSVTINLLFDKEIGNINPQDVGIKNVGEKFRFVIMADPQGGEPQASNQDSPARVKIHNAYIEESIDCANELDPKPAFSVVIGDFVDSKGQLANFQKMRHFYEKLNGPVLLEVGNHETPYSAKFSPGYNMSSLDNFFSIQKAMNGMEKILYSFNLGKWHFIVWPDPLRSDFWSTHPHYFDWLERNLEAHKDKPVMFLQHIPIHPVGINPLINYVETVEVKRLLLNILSKHGNVKYVFSGHVHIPLKASVKTAVTMKGIKFINLPAAGYRSRAFGEQDFYGGPTQGFAYIDINGSQASIYYKNVTKEVLKYPGSFPEFDRQKHALWFNHKWEIPANEGIQDGHFDKDLSAWSRRFVYNEDQHPSNVMEIRKGQGQKGTNALYLYSRKRDYDAPGQDRMPQTINRLCQVIKVKNGKYPLVNLVLKPDANHYNPAYLSSAFIWIEGFKNSFKRLNVCYSPGKMIGNIGGRFSQISNIYPTHIHLPLDIDKWNQLSLHLSKDHDKNPEHIRFDHLDLDKLVINLGTWTINDGHIQECGIYVDQVNVKWHNTPEMDNSHVNGNLLSLKNRNDIYHFRNNHTAGEHKYATQEQLYPNFNY
jgi:3',5'-cyclic AMP phosphodiesterase CpdA